MGAFELIESLSDDKADETNGREAIRGFSFQVWWAACHALELLKSEIDFVVVLEYKQDVAVLDSPIKPNRLTFYQIKKNEGVSAAPWSVNELLSRDKEARKGPTSILGKLFQHRPRFPKTPVSLGFIANCGFSYGVPKVECEEIALSDLPSDIAAKAKEAIAIDLGLSASSIDLKDCCLTRTHMPLESQQRWACGILQEVEEAAVLPFSVPNKGASAQIVAAQFLAKAGKRAFAKDFQRLLERGMTRSQLVDLLHQHSGVERRSSKSLSGEICERLEKEIYSYRKIDKMREQIARVCVDLSNRNHPNIGQLARLAAECCAEFVNDDSDEKLSADLDAVFAGLKAKHPTIVAQYDVGYVHLIVALTIKGAHELRLFSSSADSK